MKRKFLLAVACVMLLACHRESSGGKGGADASTSNDEGSKKEGGHSKGTVHITPEAQAAAGIQVVTMKAQTVPEYLTAAGQLITNEQRTAHVGTYTDGRVVAVFANVGDHVRSGSILARMHSHDVHETRAAYESALQEVKRREEALAYQQQMQARMQRLYELKSASRQEVDRAEVDVASARTDLETAKISVAKEVAHLTDILHLPPEALPGINETTEQVPVVSPISGTVINRMITPGAVVEPGEEVYTISDLSALWMLASISEDDVARIHLGSGARITTQAYPDAAFPGRVSYLSPELDPKTRTLQARITVPNPGSRLRVAMYVTAQIDGGLTRETLFVPEEALQDVNGNSIVFIRNGADQFEPRAVATGKRLNGHAEINGGLKPGDLVAVKGSFVIKSEMLKSQIGE
jgi:multidrug efflux pump subunit AcrA (membrane-fusion protein)